MSDNTDSQPAKQRKLTRRQRKFVQVLPSCKSQTEAARRAGYSPVVAGEMGCVNLMKPHVMAEVKRVEAKVEAKTQITAQWVLDRLMEIATEPEAHDRCQALTRIQKQLGYEAPTRSESKVSVSNLIHISCDRPGQGLLR